MNKTSKTKLALRQETVRRLVDSELAGIAGGRPKFPTQTCACPSGDCTDRCPSAFPCPSLHEPC